VEKCGKSGWSRAVYRFIELSARPVVPNWRIFAAQNKDYMHENTHISDTPTHTTIPGDPIAVQMYTLANGLRLYLSVNKEEPRVFTEIAVRAGSKHDPADTTGLAHYFEHMMFKGTDRLGTLDWEREKALLDQIEQRFEEHRRETDPARKRDIYAEIDRLSFEAAHFAGANEYDKLVSAMGAKSTNAYTWVEQTVYVNDIPSNELERWFRLESERFRRPILRLFHTELETVFEEYNMSQDKDMRKTMKAIQETLTPTHPYGTQTTLGRGEDLKNPSQTNIYRFFDTYYVPNNMAICMAGDFDPAEVVQLAQRHFGGFQSKPLPKFRFDPQPELTSRTLRTVHGNESPWVEMGWRFAGAGTQDAKMVLILSNLLYNQQAGLIDLHIMQEQRLLEAYAYPRFYEDFSSLMLQAKPREQQSHEDVERILMEEIERLRRGDFEDWLLDAVIKDMKLGQIRSYERNQGRVQSMSGAFIAGVEWGRVVRRWKDYEKVTKAELVAFARERIRPDNYAVAYKYTGEDTSVMKVEKPPITPIEVNREKLSDYAQAFLAQKTQDIQPVFLDYKAQLKNSTLPGGIKLKTIQNKKSQVFKLHYCFDMGRNADKRLGLLSGYLPYLGTSRHSAAALQAEFYKIGTQFSVSCESNHFYLTVSGLQESFPAALQLMEHLLRDAKPDAAAYENLIGDILVRRANNKQDKRTILGKAMGSVARYGIHSPYKDKLSEAQLRSIAPAELTTFVHQLRTYKHEVFYYGPLGPQKVAQCLRAERNDVGATLPLLKNKVWKELPTRKDEVLFVHFPSVQVELLLLSKGTPKYSLEESILSEWYNQYFGSGLSSIVFQEIRESKALAYSAYAHAGAPSKKTNAHWLQAYVCTQPDKLREAVDAFKAIMEDMPISLPQIENARLGTIKLMSASRVTKSDIYWNWRNGRELGYPNQDLRKYALERMTKATADDLIDFQKNHIKGRKYKWLVLGDRASIDFRYLRKIGKVTELSLEDIFGY
jgi:predicted Zn-dependent peptidase